MVIGNKMQSYVTIERCSCKSSSLGGIGEEVSSPFSFQRFELNNLKFDTSMRDMVEDDPNPLTITAESVLKIKRVLASTTCWFKNPKIHQTYFWSTLAVLLSNFCCNELLVAGCT